MVGWHQIDAQRVLRRRLRLPRIIHHWIVGEPDDALRIVRDGAPVSRP